MNLRTSLVSAATVTMFGLGLAGSPADAASTSCWYGNQGERLEHFECDVRRRINYNGHVVWDATHRSKIFIPMVIEEEGEGEACVCRGNGCSFL